MYRTQQRKDLSQWLIHFIHDSTTQHLPKDITPADIPDLIVECEPEDYFDSDDQNESKVNLLNEYQKILEAYHKRYPFPKAPDEEDNNETLFYGEYYDMVADPVRSQMEEIIEQDFDFVNAQKVRNAALEGLKETVKWAGTNKELGNVFYCEMDRKLIDLFSDWKLI